MSLTDALPTLIALGLALLILFWLSREISLRTQLFTYHMTGSADAATVAIFLLFLPGIILHEGAHWVMARLLGLRAGRFRVWPQAQGDRIGLGSVSVQSGGIWRDSIVGMAPLFAGTLLITLIGAGIFRTDQVLAVVADGKVVEAVGAFFRAMGTADGLVWAYVLFTVGNSMLPSSSDRQPAKPVLLYLAMAGLVYFVVGLPSAPVAAVLGWALPGFNLLVSALYFTIALDVIVLLTLLLLSFIPGKVRT